MSSSSIHLLPQQYAIDHSSIKIGLHDRRLIGDGVNRTRIKLPDFPDAWTLQGVINPQGIPDFAFLDVRDLAIIGPGTIKIDKAVKMCWNRVQLINVDVQLTTVWDSKFIDCDFVQGSSVSLRRGAFWPGSSPGDTNCNNIWFDFCTWEGNTEISLYLGEGTTKVRVDQCKFHGPWQQPTPIAPHIVGDQCYENFITRCNFMHGYQGVSLKGDNNIVCHNVFSGLANMDYDISGHNNIVRDNSTKGRYQLHTL